MANVIPIDWELSEELPNEDVLFIEVRLPWKMYFDGASHREGAGAGIMFLTLKRRRATLCLHFNTIMLK